MKTLQSERLRFCRVELSHATKKYVDWMNDKDIIAFLESGSNYNLSILKKYISEAHKKDNLFYAIHIIKSNEHIGNIKLDKINHKEKSAIYSILIGDKSKWGMGYAYEASKLIINYGFKELHLNKIILGVLKKNITAIKLYEKLNFIVLDNNYNNGKSLKMVLYND